MTNLYARYITPRTVSPDCSGGGPSDTTMRKVLATMCNMTVTLATKHEFVVAQSEKKTPGFDKLGSCAKKLIRTASAIDMDDLVTDPAPAHATL
jgi:hypothetical protein